MADNIAVTPGSGTTIAADDIGGGILAQRVKLALGADGTGVDAVAGAGNVGTGVQRMTLAADDVLVAKIPAALTGLGNLAVELPTTQIASLLDCQTSFTRPADTTAYASGDCMSDSTSAPVSGGFTFTNAASASGGGGRIDAAVVIADAATLYIGEVRLYESAMTNTNDNAAFAESDADSLLLLGKIPFTLAADVSTSSCAYITGLGIPFHCVGTANLRYKIRLTGAVTPGSSEKLTVRILGVRT